MAKVKPNEQFMIYNSGNAHWEPIEQVDSLNFMNVNIEHWQKAPKGSLWGHGPGPEDVDTWYRSEHQNLFYRIFDDAAMVVRHRLARTGTILKLGEEKIFYAKANTKRLPSAGIKIGGVFHKVLVAPEEGEQKIGWIGNDVIVYLKPANKL